MIKHSFAAAFTACIILAGCGGGGSDEGTTGVTPVVNTAPVANAGSTQSVKVNTDVTLDGSGSTDADGDALTYRWSLVSKPTGSTAALSAENVARPTFRTDATGTYAATLVVNDGKVDSVPVTVTVTSTVGNVAPVADAGAAQKVATGAVVRLNGAASSDADGNALVYRWSLSSTPVGSTAVLADASTAQPSFTADLTGTYVATLIVNDGQINSLPATVTVLASTLNAAPVANAGGSQNLRLGVSATLDGSSSYDANNDPLTFRWSLVSKPAGSQAALFSTSAVKPVLSVDVIGTYVASLVVNDGQVDSDPATVSINVSDSAAASIQLMGDEAGHGSLGLLDWPHNGLRSTSLICVITCASQPALASYKLTVNSGTATITNLKVENLTADSALIPVFLGITEGQVIRAGQSALFETAFNWVAPASGNLVYSFSIKETGETFKFTVFVRTQ